MNTQNSKGHVRQKEKFTEQRDKKHDFEKKNCVHVLLNLESSNVKLFLFLIVKINSPVQKFRGGMILRPRVLTRNSRLSTVSFSLLLSLASPYAERTGYYENV